MDAQIRQILDWSGNPERALHDFNSFLRLYSEKMGRSFDLETVNAKRLLSIFGNSFFLSEWLMKNPEEADRTVESPCIETDKKLKDYDLELEEAFKALPIQTLDSVSSLLRHYKYQEYLRLTLKDLSQAAGIESILSEISDLATCLVQKSLLYLLKEMQSDWGKPENMQDDNSLETCDFQVIAMGKWAGRELNYSSDIDFQLVYSSDQTRIIGPKQISAHEYYVKLTEKLTRLLSEKTEFGFVYRVDLNLRPEGKSGTLANSLSAIEHYYEAFGQEWERQALIKAIPIAGDARLAKEFQSLISPFVWRKTMSLETIHQMKEMKRKVHESISKGYPRGINLKLDEGGIREIEFFVQTLQLLYGGRHPEIRSPNTLLCLETLVRVGLVQTREAQQLKDAYLFLRKAEHRIQLTEEAQTHTLSSNSAEQKAVARKMGYFEDNPEEAREHFLEDLSRYRTMVQNIFNSLFE